MDRQSLSVTISDVFVFSALLLVGPEAAATLAALDGFISNIRARINKLYKHLFNIGALCLATFISGKIFYYFVGQSPPLSPAEVSETALIYLCLAGCGVLFFALNTGAVAVAISLATSQPLRLVWRENFLWGSLATVAGASVAALIFLNSKNQASILISIPIILVIYYAYRMNLTRINEAHGHARQVGELYHSTITSLAMAIDAKDQYTHGHVQRVQALALALAEAARFDNSEQTEGLRAASLLHDIGKLAIPEYILNKPSALSEWETKKMRIHPSVGADILTTVPFPYPVVPFVRHHHERWDGKGYPDGLRGNEIPMGARILAIADCYDALRSDRPYRPKLTKEATLDYFKTQSGKAYDPVLVDLLLKRAEEFEASIIKTEKELPRSLLDKIEDTMEDRQDPRRRISQTVFHDIATAHREIQAVYEISRTVGKSLNVSETLALLATKIKNLAPYDACVIYLLNSSTSTLIPYQANGDLSEKLEEVELRMGEGVSGWVAANKQNLMNVSPQPDFRNHEILKDAFVSCLAIPLASEDKTLGVIALYSKTAGVYADDHMRLMVTVSRQAAFAINNAIVYEETQEDAYTDLLTGLPNRRYFKVFGLQELKRANRTGYPVTILMMDLEFFKNINDRHGHKIGDRCLIEVTHVLRNQMRKSDTCLRFGGDEFVGILPGVSQRLVPNAIERIQQAVSGHTIHLDNGGTISLGISVGASTFPDDARELDLLLAIADQSMYRDKMSRTKQRVSGSVVPFDLERRDRKS